MLVDGYYLLLSAPCPGSLTSVLAYIGPRGRFSGPESMVPDEKQQSRDFVCESQDSNQHGQDDTGTCSLHRVLGVADHR